MAMQAESLEVLEKANVPSSQARAIVRAIEIEIDGARNTLATKHDLVLLSQELRQEMNEVRHGVELKIESRCNGLQIEIQTLRSELKEEISGLRNELKGEISGLRSELKSEGSELRGELRGSLAELRTEIHDLAAKDAWRLYGALVAQLTMLLGIAYFFVTHAVR